MPKHASPKRKGKQQRVTSDSRPKQKVARFDARSIDFEVFKQSFEKDKLVLVRGYNIEKPIPWSDLSDFYKKYSKAIHRTFFVERGPRNRFKDGEPTDVAKKVLGSRTCPRGPWYVSFIAQRNKAMLQALLRKLPFGVPPFLDASRRRGGPGGAGKPRHSESAWVFFGKSDRSSLCGRPEHTDAITHSGTWHVQLRGEKVWTLRPTSELMRSSARWRGVRRVRVHCREGDVLCINTCLWWHKTLIPGKNKFSLSVARDMCLDGRQPATTDFTNLTGYYARKLIPKDTVIFTEDEAPDLLLPRSQNANCGLRHTGEELVVVVAKRKISAGEWFSISDSEEEQVGWRSSKRKLVR